MKLAKINMHNFTILIPIILLILLLSSTSVSGALINYSANTTDSDSNIDSSTNLGNDGSTSFVDTQSQDASSQLITEENMGGRPQYPSYWTNYKTISFDSSQISSDLTGFPALIELYDSDLKSKAQSDGDDIAFFDETNQQLPHEIELYDPNYSATQAHLIVWVKVDLSSTVDTRIFMHYGNSTMASQQNAAGVWSNNYAGVWHLESLSSITDSSGNNVDGTAVGSPLDATGKIIGATEFTDPGSNQYISVANSASLTIPNTITMEAWVNPDVTNIWQTIMAKVDGALNSRSDPNLDLGVWLDTTGQYWISLANTGGNNVWSGASPAVSAGVWHHMVFTYTSSTSTGTLYINGVQQGTHNFGLGTLATNTNPFYIGFDRAYVEEVFNGRIDEARVSNTVRSGAYAAFSYLNQQDPNQTYRVSSERVFGTWDYSKNIIVQSSKVVSSVTNFPVLLSFYDRDLKTKAQNDGDDIAFFDENEIQLDHQIEDYDPNYNSTHAKLVAWVKSDLSSSSNTRLEMRYGNSTMPYQGIDDQVWSKYENVWHLNQDPSGTSPQIIDSRNNNNGTSYGSMTAGDLISGKIGNGLSFDGVDDRLNMSDLNSNLWTGLSLSAWIYKDTLGDQHIFMIGSKAGAKDSIFGIANKDDYIRARVATDGTGGTEATDINTATGTISLATWHQVVMTWSATTAQIAVYIDGQIKQTVAKDGDSIVDTSLSAFIGNTNDVDSRYFAGIIDEVRVASQGFSTGWIQTEYNNQNSPDTFYSISTELSLRITDSIDQSTSDVDSFSNIGTHSNFANMKTNDGLIDTLTENTGTVNSYSLESDGSVSNSYMQIGGDGQVHWGRTTGTISFWIMFDDLSVVRRPWGQGDNMEVRTVVSTGFAIDFGYADALDYTFSYSTATWYFMAITWNENNDTLKFYQGTPGSAPTLRATNTAWTGTTGTTILTENGFLQSRNIDTVDGRGDDLRYYGIDRSLSDIQSDYNRELLGVENNLLSYYKLNQNYLDYGPNGDDGAPGGSPTFSATIPTFQQGDSRLDIEVGWDNIPYTEVQTTLAIYAGTTSAEDIAVDYWTGSQWINIFSDLSANSWNNYTIGTVSDASYTIRFRDGTPLDDTSPSTWQIDSVVLFYENYNLDWEHQVTSIDTSQEVYDLSIYGQSSDSSESFNVQMWNQVGSNWDTAFGTKIGSMLQWYNYTISTNGLSDSQLTWRYTGDNEILDGNQNTLSIDFAAITSYTILPEYSNTPNDLVYVEGTTSHTLSWTATDTNPNTYTVYQNGSQYGSSAAWTSGGPIIINVDGLVRGTYNFTIIVVDDFGGERVDQAWVTVNDEINPTVSSPQDLIISEGDIGWTLNWSANDLHPQNYIIYQNGSQVQTSSWSNGVNISYSLNGLVKDVYNFTIVVYDDSGNQVKDTIFVDIKDTTPPISDNPLDITYSEESTSNFAEWTITDNYPSTYIILKNNQQINASTWTSGVVIREDIDGLIKGDYNYTLIAYDTSGNYIVDTILVHVIDTTPPSVSSPSDINYNEGQTGNRIIWTVDDNYPSSYILYKNGSVQYSLGWSPGSVTVNIDSLARGTYNYTIFVTDQSGNPSIDTVFVMVKDLTIPGISMPSNQTISEISTGNTMEWQVTDLHPSSYNLYLNDAIVNSGSWFTGETISYDLDPLALGTYNLTLQVFDDSGNSARDTAFVFVVDLNSPVLNSPVDITYEDGSTGHQITWVGTDLHPNQYTIFQNSMPLESGSWSSGGNIIFNVDGLTVGTYNFTIYLNDTSFNVAVDTVFVTVLDTTVPILTDLTGPITMVEDSSGNILQWTPQDTNAATYQILKNNTVVQSGSWTTGVNITYNYNSFTLGVYNITITIYDSSDNSASDQVIIKVVDQTNPVLSSPSDFPYSEKTTGNTITWTASDNHPSQSRIERNGSIISSSSWSSTGPISINIDGLGLGTYNFTITVWDTSNNVASDTVYVTVEDTTLPIISSHTDIFYAEGTTGNSITWVGTDLHPLNYIIYKDSIQEKTGTWISGNNILINIDGLLAGDYNYTIVIFDTSGNQAVDQLNVKVTAEPVFLSIPNDLYYTNGTVGHQLSWTLTDVNPSNYSIYQNGTELITGSWSDITPVTWSVDGLGFGVYNYTIWVNDTDGNFVTDEVNVFVTDLPVWDTPLPSDITDYVEGSSGNTIVWNATDMFPNTYQVYLNGTPYGSPGTWDNATAINVDIDGLSIGVYNFTISLQDTVNNTISDTVIVTVLDVTNPNLTSSQGDIPGYSEGSTGNTISWIANDTHSDAYIIRRNGTIVDSGQWIANTPVTLNIDGLKKNVYNFSIVFYDTSGNSIADFALVYVIDTTDPILVTSPGDISFANFTDTGIDATWIFTDTYNDTYIIYQNGTQVITSTWSNGTSIIYNLDHLGTGYYNLTIIVFDESGNSVFDTIFVTVTDEISPVVSDQNNIPNYLEGITSTSLSWTATDLYNSTYFIYQNGSEVDTNTWDTGIAINWNIDGLSKGIYNYTIVFFDVSGNFGFDTAWVTVSDITAPNFVSSQVNITDYSEGSTGNIISWTADDAHAGMYYIYNNSNLVISDTWVANTPVNLNIDNLVKGTYNFTIVVYDTSGNSNAHTAWVTVIDDTPPSVSGPADFSYTEGMNGHWINWTATDNYAQNYTIYRNDVNVTNSLSWSSGIRIDYGIDGMSKGTYNYTILFEDASGNQNSDTVWVTVTDDTAPAISSTADFSYSEGTTGHWINWTATDLYNATYTVSWNTTNVVGSGSWTSGIPINTSIDGLSKGLYNFTIMVVDASGNWNFDTVWVTVTDDTAPVIIVEQSDIPDYIEGNTPYSVSWTAIDLHNDTYIIYVNNTSTSYIITDSGSWNSGTPISLNIDGLSKGIYNYTIIFYDTSGNFNTSTAWVTVSDITMPSIINITSDFTYNEGDTSNVISWTPVDSHPATYEIYQNTSLKVSNNPWTSNNPVNRNIDGLLKGIYNFTIIFYDESGNFNTSSVFITVFDNNAPVISSPADIEYSEGTTGNQILWSVSDQHPTTYSIISNSTINDAGSWTSPSNIIINIDGLAKGIYNFTILLYDESGNSNIDQVFVTVADITKPTISTPANIAYEEGTSGHNITWIANDLYNSTYEISNGTYIVQSGPWSNGQDIVVDIDGLKLGEYEWSITVYDTSGNYQSDYVSISVYEITPPNMVAPDTDITYAEGDTGYNITMRANDTYPGYYQIYRNNVFLKSISNKAWFNSENITIDVDGLARGTYNYTFYIRDSSGNTLQTFIMVYVLDLTDPVFISTPSDFTYQSGSNIDEINWTASDTYFFTYDLYDNGSLIADNAVWVSMYPIYFNVSDQDLELGRHNITIEVFDRSGNSIIDTIYIDVIDTIDPNLSSSTSNYTYDEGTTGHSIQWIYTDVNPRNYDIRKNGSSVETGVWSSGSQIQRIIDGLTKGTYNYTILIYDNAGNWQYNTIIITVVDVTSPKVLTSPGNVTYVEQTIGNNLVWDLTDLYETDYYLYRNSSLYDQGVWTSDDDLVVSIDGLKAGTHSFTLIAFDASGNNVTDILYVTVLDETVPIFNETPEDQSIIEGTTGNLIIWEGYDIHADQFIIYQNGEEYQSGQWTSNNSISLNLDVLDFGDYNFTILLFDESGNTATDMVYVEIFDTTPPVFVSRPGNFTIIQGTTGNVISWEIYDKHPANYTLIRIGDPEPYALNTWISNRTFSINIDLIADNLGYYTFTIEVMDASGNTIFDTAEVRVKDPNVTDTHRPEIDLINKVYEGDVEIYTGTWLDVNDQPVSNADIQVELSLQGNLRTLTFKTGTDGSYSLRFNYTNLLPGKYTWSLSFSKDLYQRWDDIEIKVEVIPHNYQIEFIESPKLVKGEEYIISARLTYNNLYNSTQTPNGLYLSSIDYSRMGAVKGVNVTFTFILLMEDGKKTDLIQSGTTNDKGIAIVTIEPEYTRNLQKIQSISAEVLGSATNNGVTSSLAVDRFPTIEEGAPTWYEQLQSRIEEYQMYIVAASLLVVLIFAALLALQRRREQRIKALNDTIKLAVEEIQGIESLVTVIIQTKNKNTMYEEIMFEEAVNTNLVGGMVTAFTSFLNEIGRSPTDLGFQMMERGNVAITVHKGPLSNFIVISRGKLPFVMMSQIVKAQQLVEQKYATQLDHSVRGVAKLTKEDIHPLFRKAGFKISLTQPLSLNDGNLAKLYRQRSISRVLKQNAKILEEMKESSYYNGNKFFIQDVLEFFNSKGINRNITSRVLIIANEFDVLEQHS